eukprot:Gb_03786 [translate_table: standard]
MEEELMDSLEDKVLPKKKSKGKNAKETTELNGSLETRDADAEELEIPRKKKGKKEKKGSKIKDDEFDVSALREKSDEPPQEELQQMEPKFGGKKKAEKSKQDENEDIIMQRELQNDYESKINKKKSGEKSIQRKKKARGKKNSLFTSSSFDVVLAEELGEGLVPLKSTLSKETVKLGTIELEPASLLQMSVDVEAEGVAKPTVAKKEEEKEKEKKAAIAATLVRRLP